MTASIRRDGQASGGGTGTVAARLPSLQGFEPGPEPFPTARARGKELRQRVPRTSHAGLGERPDRPDAVAAVEASNTGRLPHLTPIRVGRMTASPFAFLRGAAGLMAYDLVGTPSTGVGTQICGDAHAGNYGLYGDHRGLLVIDINDFDETVHGPWEWDLKRLVTSLVLAARVAGADENTCREAAFDTAGSYRRTMRLLSRMGAADAWNAIADEALVSHADARDLVGTLQQVAEKARRNTSARFAARATEDRPDGGLRFTDAPPVLRRVPDAEAAAVAAALGPYRATLPDARLPLLSRYSIQDVAFRVVGTGSVGARSYVVLLLDHRGEPLVLQVKEARPSALLPHVKDAGFAQPHPGRHEGHRVVHGQQLMQVVSDPLLGWTSVAGLPYQVRQFRNRKGSVDPAELAAGQFDDYGRMTGALLARAHARGADPRLISGYCGKGEALDSAMAEFAVLYADRTEADHERLTAAVRAGRIAAELDV